VLSRLSADSFAVGRRQKCVAHPKLGEAVPAVFFLNLLIYIELGEKQHHFYPPIGIFCFQAIYGKLSTTFGSFHQTIFI
jgi:hypothetical protein